jgi:Protein of unknown function (DUF4079)
MAAFVHCSVNISSFAASFVAKSPPRAVPAGAASAAVSLRRRAPPSLPALRACAAPPAQGDADAEIASPTREDDSFSYALFSMAAAASVALSPTLPAMAEVPLGVTEAFKSLPASLMHPGTMWALFALALYTGNLGWQSRQIRSVDAETRKALVKAKVTQRHFAVSSMLMATMTVFTFIGMANTFTRTGKLFPGPHLYAGLGLVALMTVMASLVPYMQKGQNAARDAHLALAVGAVGLFGWQAKTGLDIVQKLTKWW